MWNVFVLLVFVAQVRLGALGWEAAWWSAANLTLLAALYYGFLGRQRRELVTLVGWAILGWLLGTGWAAFNIGSFWLGLGLILGLLLVYTMLTDWLATRTWLRFITRRPEGWKAPQQQSRPSVLASGPFQLKPSLGNDDMWEVHTQQGYASNHSSRQDAEQWVIDRYTAYRQSKKLPVDAELLLPAEPSPPAKPMTAPPADSRWHTDQKLTPAEILAFSPYVLIGSSAAGAIVMRYDASGKRDVDSFYPAEYPEIKLPSPLPAGFQLYERGTWNMLSHDQDLSAAEAEVVRRYHAQWHKAMRLDSGSADQAEETAETPTPSANKLN